MRTVMKTVTIRLMMKATINISNYLVRGWINFITLDMMSNRAYFTLCFTRFEEACAVRLLRADDDSIYEGDWSVSGTIKATQILFNQISRTLTLFKSESPVAIASRDLSINQSIPFKGSAVFKLSPDSTPLENICLEEIAAHNGFKMNIQVTPFYATDAENIHESLKDLAI